MRLKFDIERLNRQIERRSSRADTDGTESVCRQVQMALLFSSLCKLYLKMVLHFLVLKPDSNQHADSTY